MNVVIIDTGVANISSVKFAFERLSITPLVSSNSEVIKQADRVVIPGVGSAPYAMKLLKQKKLVSVLKLLKQPVLGICLGMQLLCKHSEEGHTKGLGVFDVNVKRFTNAVKVPHMGWNTIHNHNSDLLINIPENSYMYSVHSYYAGLTEQTIASSNYEHEFSAALQSNNFYGVQFHPEKSSKDGSQLLQNFLNL